MKSAKANISLLKSEMVITKTLISMSIMVPFYNSIGMNQLMIGFSQSIFTIAMILMNIPTGWIADKFSRRWCNAIGDLFSGLFFIYYSTATSFSQIVIAEILLGISMSFSDGADLGLMMAYCDKSGNKSDFQKHIANVHILSPLLQIIGVTFGGFIGAYDFRLAIAVSSVPYLVGFVISLLLEDAGEKLISHHENPIIDICHFTKQTLTSSRELRWKIVACVVNTQMTHVMIWGLTPLLLLAKVPPPIGGIGWAICSASNSIGAKFAKSFSRKLETHQIFAVSGFSVLFALAIMSLHLSIITIWLYSILGIAQGWNAATMKTSVQQSAPNNMQAIVASTTSTIGNIAYAILLPIVSFAGNVDIRFTMLATIVIFGPLVITTFLKLKSLVKC